MNSLCVLLSYIILSFIGKGIQPILKSCISTGPHYGPQGRGLDSTGRENKKRLVHDVSTDRARGWSPLGF